MLHADGRRRSIHQLLPTFSYGDAIGNEVLHLQALFRSWGFDSEVFAGNIDPRLATRTLHSSLLDAHSTSSDVLVFHYSIYGDELNAFRRSTARRVLVYHNITPARFFVDDSLDHYYLTDLGRRYLPDVIAAADFIFADSPYNAQEVALHGRDDCRVLPLFIDFRQLETTPPSRAILDRYSDGVTNVLFVGRVAPNKRQDDLITAFARYHEMNPRSRLLVVGSSGGFARYEAALRSRARAADVDDAVVFAGHVELAELVAYYRVAHVFVSMSEHEGFGVPLVEAMHFGVPVIAFGCCAVPYTMGGAGIVFDEKDPDHVASLIHQVTHDPALRTRLVSDQRRRVADFAEEKIAAMLRFYLREVVGP